MTAIKIAYQGIFGSFSSIACVELYGAEHNFIAFERFDDVIRAVESSECEYGVIPVENSCAGRVSEIHSILPSTNLQIVAEKILKVEHCLAVKSSSVKMENIAVVTSHEQALAQCREGLRRMLPNARIQKDLNTAIAARNVQESTSNNIACLCSKLAAKEYGLHILKENFQDSDENYTTFFSFSKNPFNPSPASGKRIVTSVIFSVRNIAGAVYKCLGGFATNGIDLLKLESYIPGGVYSKSAQFFLSFYGHANDANVSLALEELGFFSTKVKILGIYYADDSRA